MKHFQLLIAILLFHTTLGAQFDAVAYDFTGNVGVLQYNPGNKYPYKNFFGIPFLTNTQVFAGSSGFNLNDLFASGSSFEEKVHKTANRLSNTDFAMFSYRHDLFSYGWTNDLQVLKYFGLYFELQHITYTPADFVKLGLYGNGPYIDQTFDAKYLATKTELVQTIYFGIHRKLNPNLHIGWRFKLYSGLVNAQNINNTGTFYTTQGQNNFYKHHFDDLDIKLQSSGYREGEGINYYLAKLIFSGNYGPGIDFGLTYRLNKKTFVSASVLDLGFIYYTTDLKNYYIKGNYEFEGANLQFPENNLIDYWKDIKDNFNRQITNSENTNNFISWRPTKLYSSVKYGLGNLTHQDCRNFINPVAEYSDFIGLTGFAQWQPVKFHFGASAFYEKKWTDSFYTKINLTADNFSYYSLGGGFVLNIGRVQLSLLADNLIGFSNLAQSKKQSVQFGLNLVR